MENRPEPFGLKIFFHSQEALEIFRTEVSERPVAVKNYFNNLN